MEAMRKFREKLKSGQICIGSSVTFSDSAATEALCPYIDFLWIDMEHTALDMSAVQNHLIAARAGGVASIVRVPGSETSIIKPVLDSGTEGLIVPHVRSAEQVRQIVADCRYTPMGRRGFGPRRPSRYGHLPASQYIAEANRDLFVVAQIETAEALNELDEIVKIPGLDSLALGPNDLASALGYLNQLDHPKVVQAMETVIAKARGAGLFIGSGLDCDEQFAASLARMGVQWLQMGCDYHYLTYAMKTAIAGARSRVGEMA